MIRAGLNVARLNFSHGTYEDHEALLKIVRTESAALDRPVAVLQDLSGPKVRIGEVENGEIRVVQGQTIQMRQSVLGSPDCIGNQRELYVEAFDPLEVLRPGERVLLADGRIVLVAQRIVGDGVECSIMAGGALRSRSGCILPNSRLNLPCLTPKDKKDIKWGVEHKVDYIALSFVGTAQDIHDARSELECGNNSTIPIIAKIERALALKDLDNIAAASDAMMVARGDLGLELPMERVPVAQRQIIARAGSAGIPVITATQMLLSMVTEVRPTRAEVSDVFTAVRDGTDAVMLSEETTIGHDPVAAVRMLSQILEEAEQELSCEHNWQLIRTPENARVADAVCIAACSAADKVSAAGIIACTLSGSTARLLSKYRPLQPLFAATPDPNTLPRMALYWGIEPILTSLGDNTNIEYEITEAMCHIRDHYGVKPGMKIVVTAGLRSGEKGGTNVMEVRLIPR